VIDLAGLPQVLWPVHCVAGSAGFEFHPKLDTSRFAAVFPKGTDEAVDSYSGFFDNAQRKATGLAEYLREKHVDEVYVMGLATDYCVKATALDAIQLGLRTAVIEDGCRGVGIAPGDIDAAKAEMRAAGVRFCQSESLAD
jgi:nicotinamidase/pyrazinamidase